VAAMIAILSGLAGFVAGAVFAFLLYVYIMWKGAQ
jgi:hypothetical protein